MKIIILFCFQQMQAPHLPLAAGHLPSIPLAPHPGAGLSGSVTGSSSSGIMGRLAGSGHLHGVKEEKGQYIFS